ncbi:4-hydroxy-3-methylbut-2-enyl diphosphate reductase [Streptococcaceae bacterium ESL0687]|nr:4-hydroxy-3-methylbut-2-enyl diphosphate reductase [Streptococcaceae bacterium ESL0687]
MKIKHITPMGYCYGVIDAMVIAKNVAMDESLPRPIYILGMIVHNAHVTSAFESIGIKTIDGHNRLEIVDKIDSGTVIFTAHGVSDQVRKKADEKGLVTIDASCPDVLITHEIVRKKIEDGKTVIYIGKEGHPEPEGVLGISDTKIHLISKEAQINDLRIEGDIFVTNQTTMSMWDVEDIMNAILKKYPQAEIHRDICQATNERQQAVAEQAVGCDLTIVVGDPRSNNSNRLAQVSEEQAGVKAYRVADVGEIKLEWLENVTTVAVTAGASTPTAVVREVINFLDNYDGHKQQSKVESEDILPRGGVRDLTKKRQRRLEKLREQNQ